MYSREPKSTEAIALAHASTAANFKEYAKALEYVRSITLHPDSALWAELHRTLYLSYRGVGDLEAARKHFDLFDTTSANHNLQAKRLHTAIQVLTHFSDADVAAYLVELVTDQRLRSSRPFKMLAFMIKVARGEAPLHEQLNFLWRATIFEPDEDWMAHHIINENDDPAILKRVIELLDSIKEKAEPGYGDAIENRKAQAYLKLKSL